MHRPPHTFGPIALAQLQAHVWPGNVRELQHAVKQAALFTPAGVIEQAELFALPGGFNALFYLAYRRK